MYMQGFSIEESKSFRFVIRVAMGPFDYFVSNC